MWAIYFAAAKGLCKFQQQTTEWTRQSRIQEKFIHEKTMR